MDLVLICFPFNRLFPGATLIEDIVLTTPMYIGAHLAWFWILRKYKFTCREAFYTGGISIGILELVFGGMSATSLLVIIVWPFLTMIHGCHMIIPRIALDTYFVQLNQNETR